jgi:hypothetical protein
MHRGPLKNYAPVKISSSPRRSLDPALAKLAPERGFIFLSGGFVSTPRRCVVDLQRGTFVLEDGGKLGASSFEPHARRVERALAPQETADLTAKANAVWASSDSFMNMPPIADFDVRLVLADGEAVRDIRSYGPPRGAVDALYDAAMLLAP